MTTYEFRFLSVFIPINIINSINLLYNFYLHLVYGKMFSLSFPLSWIDRFILLCKCLNSLYCSIFNLWKWIALTLSREVNHSFKACDWLLITDVTFICTRSITSGSKPELTKKVDDQLRGTNKSRLDWFGFVNSNESCNSLSLFSSHHGTGPRFMPLYSQLIGQFGFAIYNPE